MWCIHKLCVCVCAWMHICEYEIVTQLSAEGRFLPRVCLIASSHLQDQRFLPQAQSSILNSSYMWLGGRVHSSPRYAEKQRFIMTHNLLSSASSVSCRDWIWKICLYALVRRLDFVPELIMVSCLQASVRLSFLTFFLPSFLVCFHY